MLLRALFASLLLALPTAALATPVSIEIVPDDDGALSDPGTFSTIDGDCSTGLLSSCGGGYSGLSGTLQGDLAGDVLSGLSGDIHVEGLGTLYVSNGLLDLGGGLDSFLSTNFGTFHFGSFGWTGSSGFWAYGSNWGSYCNLWGCKRFWLRLQGQIDSDAPGTQVPEPSAALLFGLGALVVSQRVTRRR